MTDPDAIQRGVNAIRGGRAHTDRDLVERVLKAADAAPANREALSDQGSRQHNPLTCEECHADGTMAEVQELLDEIGHMRELLDHFDRYASVPSDVEYNGSPFQKTVRSALGIDEAHVAAPCGRLLVGQGDETYDPLCVLPAGHKDVCKPEGGQ